MTMQQYCLRWNNHQPNFISVFSSLLNSESLVDVTLAAEGRHLQAHKVVLSACSSYFQSLFTINPCQHPIVILKDVKFADLKIIIDFMYYGEVNVSQEQLPYILKTAETLKIKGLAEIPVDQSVAKTQNNMMEKTELLTPGDPNWGSDGGPRQSVSPVPCPLSPSSKRKRLRKSSTGSGSGSTERASDEHHSGEMTLTSSGSSIGGTVIKADPGGYASDTGTMLQKSKQHSSDSELHRGSSHESMEGEMTHHVTLQVPQDVSVQHSLEAATSVEVAGPSSNTSQLSLGGMQWNVMEHAAYAQFSSCASPTALMPSSPPFGGPQGGGLGGGGNQHHPHHHHHQQQHHQHQQQHHQLQGGQTGGGGGMNPPSPTNSQCYQSQIANSPPQMIQKRKRSINPQGDENFIRALEAVRFGGIGFCKAARMYGVNNRTLWLEYKKRGYPNFRLSIKKRNQEGATVSTPGLGVQVQGDVSEPPPSPSPHTPDHSPLSLPDKQEVQDQQMCAAAQAASAHPVALISSAFFDGKHVDLGSVLQSRPKYLETTLMNSQQGAINYHNINYEQM